MIKFALKVRAIFINIKTMKAKTFLVAVAALFITSLQVMAQNNQRVLVAYFSATGVTAQAAEKISAITGGTLYAITPENPYTDADLDWRDKQSRSSVEMKDAKSRPALATDKALNTADYDVVFIGFPIWWDLAPRVINTFIESHDLKGKTVVPFATSGSSSILNSAKQLKADYPELNWKEGKLLNNLDDVAIRQWAEQ